MLSYDSRFWWSRLRRLRWTTNRLPTVPALILRGGLTSALNLRIPKLIVYLMHRSRIKDGGQPCRDWRPSLSYFLISPLSLTMNGLPHLAWSSLLPDQTKMLVQNSNAWMIIVGTIMRCVRRGSETGMYIIIKIARGYHTLIIIHQYNDSLIPSTVASPRSSNSYLVLWKM
jgi:hypothetical protein